MTGGKAGGYNVVICRITPANLEIFPVSKVKAIALVVLPILVVVVVYNYVKANNTFGLGAKLP